MGGNFGVSLADAIMLSMTGCMQSQMDRSMGVSDVSVAHWICGLCKVLTTLSVGTLLHENKSKSIHP